MGVKFTFADVAEELIRAESQARLQARSAERLKDKQWHSGRASAFREAAETYDAARRSAGDNGAPVELRTFDEIAKEHTDDTQTA